MVRVCHGVTTASPNPSFRVPLRMGDAAVGRGNTGRNFKERTSLPVPDQHTTAFIRKEWKKISDDSSLMFPPATQSVEGLNCSELDKTFTVD